MIIIMEEIPVLLCITYCDTTTVLPSRQTLMRPLTDLTPAVKRPEYGRPHVQGRAPP